MMPPSLQIPCITKNYFPETTENLKKICAFAGYEVSVHDSATCCGLPYFEKGELKPAKTIGEYNLTMYGQQQVICGSSKCEMTYVMKYPKIFNNTVSHNASVQLSKNTIGLKSLFEKIPQKKLDQINGKYFLVPDCYDTERMKEQIRKLGNCQIVYSALHANCCGAGTCLPVFNKELATEMANSLISEFMESGTEYLVFEDDICRQHMIQTAALKGIELKTLNLIDLFAGVL